VRGKGGRPKGSTSAELKLDSRADEVQAYVNLRLPQRRAAELLDVSPHTLRLFIKRRNIKPTVTMPGKQHA